MDVRNLVLATSALATFCVGAVAPTRIATVDFRGTFAGSVVVVDRHSPAYAALEDIRTQYPLTPNDEISTLARNESLMLGRLKLTQSIVAGTAKIEEKEKVARLELSRDITSAGKLEAAAPSSQDHLAQLIRDLDEEIEPPTAVQMGEMLVQEELARRASPDVRYVPTEAGANILVSKVDIPVTPSSSKSVSGPFVAPPPATPAPAVVSQAQNSDSSSHRSKRGSREIVVPPPRAPASSEKPAVIASNEKDDGGFSAISFTPSQPARYTVGGPITFSGGMAFLGGRHQITVRQIVDDLTVGEGYVNIREAMYGLDVERLEGEVLAEVRDEDGHIMGQGRANLYEVRHLSQNIANIKNLEIQLRPVFNGASGTAVSAASYGKAKYVVADAKVFINDLDREILKNKKSGLYEDETLAQPSTYMIRSQHASFWPSIAMAASGEAFQLRLFPLALMKALFELSSDKFTARDAAEEGVIWGRVTYGGQPVSGAQVHLVGEGTSKPIYFTGFLPDKAKTATTSRGEFAFTRLADPELILRVNLQGKLFWPTLLPVAKKHVSYADLEIEASRNIEVKSFEAFSGSPLPAVFRPLGTADEILIPETGEARVQVDTVKGLTLVESDAGADFTPLRVALRSGQSEIQLPQIRADWLKSLYATKTKTESAFQTALVGFIENDDYDVLVGSGGSAPNANIVYFSSEGKVQKQGTAGGGFVVFDLPRGLHTLTVLPDKSKKVVTQAVYVDEYATHLTRINLGY